MGARASISSSHDREISDISKPNGYADGKKKRVASGRSVENSDNKRKRQGSATITINSATFKFSSECDYSDTYHMYTTKDDNLLQGYPPPHPPSEKKEDIFDQGEFKNVDKKAKQVPVEKLKCPMSTFVRYLTSRYDDELSKLRVMYTWLTSLNFDRIHLPVKEPTDGTVISYLWKIKQHKGNYAQLFSIMCSHAGILNVVIHGYLKGSTYTVGMRMNKELHYGEWNAVLIYRSWHFVDTFWGSTSVESENSKDVIHRTDDNFFLSDPDQFIYSHFPEEKRWQLISPPKTLGDFERKVYLTERFFELDMKVLSHPECELHVEDGEIELLFGIDPDRKLTLEFLCFVFLKESDDWNMIKVKRQQPDFIHFSSDSALSINIRFPKVGEYKIEIVGKDNTQKAPDYDFDWVAIYTAKVDAVKRRHKSYPKCGEAGWGPRKALETVGLEYNSHDTGIILAEEGKAQLVFDVVERQEEELGLSFKLGTADDNIDDLLMEEDGFRMTSSGFVMDINLDDPIGSEFALWIFTTVPHTKYGHIDKNICNYLVVVTDVSEEELARRKDIEMVRQQLQDAIEQKVLDLLETAVQLVEAKGYEKYMPEDTATARELIHRLRYIQLLTHNVLALDQKTVAEIKSYQVPVAAISDILRAVLLLLGNYEEETQTWKDIQHLFSRMGRESIRRRINLFNLNTLPLDICLGAKQMLSCDTGEAVKNLSQGVAAFHSWAIGVIQEIEYRADEEKLRTTIPRTKRKGFT